MAEQHHRKKQKKLTSKIRTVVTNIMLDDARNGFKNGNFICSPFSLEIVLGMLAAGAEGKTLKQLLGFLGHETIDHLLSESPSSKLLAKLLSNPNNGGGSLDIGLANAIWVDKKLNGVQAGYEEVLKSVYKTKARFVDFKNKPIQSVRKINSWVNKNTRGLIPTIVEEGELNPHTLIVLANALYFKGLWSDPFDEEDTEEKDFHLINGETVSVPFMTSIEEFNYGSFEGYDILQIPYESKGQSNEFSMYIFLPDRKDGLQDVLQDFHSNPSLFHKEFYLKSRDFDELWIPKFKISYKFEAQDVMKQMGLTLPFKPTNMELRGIIDSSCPDGDKLSVSSILQKSFIEIDEKGTEATAASAVVLRVGCRRPRTPPPPANFEADHPFMFMIREDTSLAVFFVGVVLNPLAN